MDSSGKNAKKYVDSVRGEEVRKQNELFGLWLAKKAPLWYRIWFKIKKYVVQ